MPNPSIAPALAARGIPITLSDGTEVPLRYTMASVIELEREYGNLARIQTTTNDAVRALQASQAVANGTATDTERETDAAYQGSSVFAVVCTLLAAGLLDVQVNHPRSGEPIWLGEHIDAVQRLLDPAQLQPYLDAFGQSFSQAFASSHTGAGDAVPPTRPATRPRSPGRSGGTSPSASRVTAPRASGA
jgi:hypothetical protein